MALVAALSVVGAVVLTWSAWKGRQVRGTIDRVEADLREIARTLDDPDA